MRMSEFDHYMSTTVSAEQDGYACWLPEALARDIDSVVAGFYGKGVPSEALHNIGRALSSREADFLQEHLERSYTGLAPEFIIAALTDNPSPLRPEKWPEFPAGRSTRATYARLEFLWGASVSCGFVLYWLSSLGHQCVLVYSVRGAYYSGQLPRWSGPFLTPDDFFFDLEEKGWWIKSEVFWEADYGFNDPDPTARQIKADVLYARALVRRLKRRNVSAD